MTGGFSVGLYTDLTPVTKLSIFQLRSLFRSIRNRAYHLRQIDRWWTVFGASNGAKMEETVQKSCWGVTARAVIGFAGVLALVYLFGGI